MWYFQRECFSLPLYESLEILAVDREIAPFLWVFKAKQSQSPTSVEASIREYRQ